MGKHNNNMRLIKRPEEVGFVNFQDLDHANHSPVYPQRLSKEERGYKMKPICHQPAASRTKEVKTKTKVKKQTNTYAMRYKN